MKLAYHALMGMLGGVVIGIVGFLALMTYGGNNGCFPFVDTLLGLQGYESCGQFGGIVGILIGSFLGVWYSTKIDIRNYKKAIAIVVGLMIVLPMIVGIVLMGAQGILIVGGFILVMALFSLLPSLLAAYVFLKRESKQIS